ncbi:hypothetical protein ACJJIF_07710 [Microbulbifer sp. SSSA002]|uniref:hypothetical protein n=1 Tax=unclassified Microbulbifer TaxID=2619833 RepID=UPI0040395EA1
MKYSYSLKNALYGLFCLAASILFFMVDRPEAFWCGLVALFLFIVFLFSPILEDFHKRRAELRQGYIEFDSEEIRKIIPDRQKEGIKWLEISEIAITTGDMGPFNDDLYWIIMDSEKNKRIAVSNDALGLPELVEKLQALPKFDHGVMLMAMGSVENNYFVVWRR